MDQIVDGGWLLRHARTAARLSQTALATSLGVNQSVVSRIEGGQDPGFAELQRFLIGADRRLKLSLAAAPQHRVGMFDLFEPNDHELRRLLPDQLCSRRGRLDGDTAAGPTVSEASYVLWQVQHLATVAATPESWLQSAYYAFGIERDRGLVHAVLHCGAGAHHAARVLDATIANVPAPGKARFGRGTQAAEPHIDALAYAHATLSVRAEATLCAQAARYLDSTARSAQAVDKRRRTLSYEQEHLTVARQQDDDGPESEYTSQIATKVRELEAELERREQERDRHHVNSGTFDSIGAAGERVLTVAYTAAACQAWHVYRNMAAHPSTTAWLPAPDDPPEIPELDGNYTLTDTRR